MEEPEEIIFNCEELDEYIIPSHETEKYGLSKTYYEDH